MYAYERINQAVRANQRERERSNHIYYYYVLLSLLLLLFTLHNHTHKRPCYVLYQQQLKLFLTTSFNNTKNRSYILHITYYYYYYYYLIRKRLTKKDDFADRFRETTRCKLTKPSSLETKNDEEEEEDEYAQGVFTELHD